MNACTTGRVLGSSVLCGMVVAMSVYGYLLDLRERADPGAAHPVLVQRATLGSPILGLDRETMRSAARQAGASNELVEAVGTLSGASISLARLAADRGYPRADPDELEEVLRPAPSSESAWAAFFREHPDAPGVLHFSPVAFAADETEAGVVETFRCGVDCGQSRFLLLERGPGGWTVMAEVPLWVP